VQSGLFLEADDFARQWFDTQTQVTDDLGYLDWVEATIIGVEEAIKTDQTYVVKIDNWFGKRWLGFSGKALGVLGVRKEKLTLPPFIPSRVVSQRRFFEAGTPLGRRKRLHVWQRSGENLQRYTEVVLQGSHAFWYSGRSASNDRGSFMAYVATPAGYWPWYVSLLREEKWRVVECIGIGTRELENFTGRGIKQLREAAESQSL
jgi:hypothetical protein